jgi:hypothetical protein
MIRTCAALSSFDEQSTWIIERAMKLERASLAPIQQTAWRLMLRSKRTDAERQLDERWFWVASRIKAGDAGFAARRIVAKVLRPRLVIEKAFRWGDDPAERSAPETLNSLFHLDFKAEQHPRPEEIVAIWPKTEGADLALFRTLDRTLVDALEDAEDVGFLTGWDRSDDDVPSIAAHPQNSYHSGFYPLVRVLADLWDRIAQQNPQAVIPSAIEWSQSRFRLLRRLALFAMNNSVFTPKQAADNVISLAPQFFWLGGAQVEIMRLVLTRWMEFDEPDRMNIEARLCAGIPRELLRDDIADEHWLAIRDSTIYRRLARFSASGLSLSQDGVALLADLADRHPQWQPSPGDRDDFHSWHESRSGPDGHPELLMKVKDSDLVQQAFRLQHERCLEEEDVWRMFCAIEPDRALRGLAHEAESRRWQQEAWQGFMWEAPAKGDAKFQFNLADLVLKMPDDPLRQLLGSATSWLRKNREILSNEAIQGGACFLKLWDRFGEITYNVEAEVAPGEAHADDDLSSEALVEPGGVLVWTLLDSLAAGQPNPGDELNSSLEPRFTRAVATSTRSARFSRVALAQSLAYLDQVAPAWTSANLFPLFSWNSPEALAMWRSYSQGEIGSARLFNALKEPMLQSFEHPGFPDHESAGLMENLLSIGLWHQQGHGTEYLLSTSDIRRVLTLAPPAVRQNASWILWRMMTDAKEDLTDKAERWRTLIGPFFRAIWPLDGNLRSVHIAQNLVHMVSECKEVFPEAVEAVLDIVVPYQLNRLEHSLLLLDEHKHLHTEHPTAFVKLTNALIDPALFTVPDDLAEVLSQCVVCDPGIVNLPAYRRLYALRRLRNA